MSKYNLHGICLLLISLIILLLIENVLSDAQTTETTGETVPKPEMHVPAQYVMRCSRRFTPGVCSASVGSVWTYVFHLQNCTERLGCFYSTRTNRFRSYSRCMRRCKPLRQIYMHILTDTGDNDNVTDDNEELTTLDIEGLYSYRREGDKTIDLNNMEYNQKNLQEPSDEAYDDSRGDEPQTEEVDDTNVLYDLVEPDIDQFA